MHDHTGNFLSTHFALPGIETGSQVDSQIIAAVDDSAGAIDAFARPVKHSKDSIACAFDQPPAM